MPDPLLDLNRQDVVLAEGRAGAVSAIEELAVAFRDKYALLLGNAGLAQWRETFSVPILVTVSKIVAWRRQEGQLTYRSVP